MIEHILVALDGTSLAEAALPHTRLLAKLLGARVTLLHVLEPVPPPLVHGERHLTKPAEAEEYLAAIAQQLTTAGIPCAVHVHSEDVTRVAGGIVAHEEELKPDLIIMCTHGPGKLERLLRGSLAQQVVALGQTPLLLTNPGYLAPEQPVLLRRILVALDGDERHEGGYALACSLAAASQARLHLLSVVPELSSLAGRRASQLRYLPGASWFLQRMNLEKLRIYLGRLLAKAEQQGIEVAGEIKYGKVPRTICSMAEDTDADLIVLATHGKAGAQAFWANSTAAQVQGQTVRPLLLVPV